MPTPQPMAHLHSTATKTMRHHGRRAPALAKFMACDDFLGKAPRISSGSWGNSVPIPAPRSQVAYSNNYNGCPPLGNHLCRIRRQQGVAVPQLAKWRYNLQRL